MEELAELEAASAARGYRVRFERVTVCTLPLDGEAGCATLEEAAALLERIQRVAAGGGIRNAHIVDPSGMHSGTIPSESPGVFPDGRLRAIGGAPPTDTPGSGEQAMATSGPLRLSRAHLDGLNAAVARLSSLPRVPSERLQALRQDADDGDESGTGPA